MGKIVCRRVDPEGGYLVVAGTVVLDSTPVEDQVDNKANTVVTLRIEGCHLENKPAFESV